MAGNEITPEELRKFLPNVSASIIRANQGPSQVGKAGIQPDGTGPVAKLERNLCNGALGTVQIQKGIGPKFFVRVTSVRSRLLDEDNLCEKYHVDLCRYAGALPKDSPGTAHIEVRQEKVEPGAPEEVRIEIYLLDP